ncbi:M10 family metallopeptidase C-terminal domain-containing protein [Cereibacter azotoformans]|uniref:Peptidase M10, serralysin-like protein n=1 Tax=Cereibacter sphaeroides (strain ATCC 17025 / ATH 2.4.3) TaxID=349102 RepID=A4WSD0_CERS5|nr:M10 family metallopeptidase [Cereibacter azotoformans]ULB09594.1 M10 family metallopeptidase C-terminal domain-containing protein [Cereibacter azotoformans]
MNLSSLFPWAVGPADWPKAVAATVSRYLVPSADEGPELLWPAGKSDRAGDRGGPDLKAVAAPGPEEDGPDGRLHEARVFDRGLFSGPADEASASTGREPAAISVQRDEAFAFALGPSATSGTSFAPSFGSVQQIATQLVSGYWQWKGAPARAYDVKPGDTLNVDFSGLTADGKRLATLALQSWSDVTGIRFNTNPARLATVHITMDDVEPGASTSTTYMGSKILKSHVNIGTKWLSDYGTDVNSYSLQTYIHELGHALGLGHPGNYNGWANYGTDNLFLNDSWQATVMSYFSQTENTTIKADRAFVVTPMIADIVAVQMIYGTPSGLRAGNTTYGDNSNAGGMYDRIASLPGREVAWTIYDQGGRDILDLRSATAAQVIDLRPGSVSNVYGAVGNLSIAQGTVIEVARGGKGNDVIIGNSAHNDLSGGGGSDTLRGGAGNDIYRVDGGDRVIELAGNGIDRVISSASFQLGAHVENLTLTGNRAINGTGNDLANVIVGNGAANVLTGRGGADSFVFSTALGGGNVDRITDFNVVDDTIRLDDAIFRALAPGRLAGSAFSANAAGRAKDATDRIIYETDTGSLWYDADGTGGAAPIRFAVLAPGLSVTAADFLVI